MTTSELYSVQPSAGSTLLGGLCLPDGESYVSSSYGLLPLEPPTLDRAVAWKLIKRFQGQTGLST